MTGARERILQAVRAGLGGARQPPAAIAAEAMALLADPELIRPNRPDIGLVERFIERACVPKVGTTVDRVESLAELPGRRAPLPRGPWSARVRRAAAGTPSWSAWTGRGSRHTAGMAADEPVGVGIARWGIAETGSLVFHSGPEMPILSAFLPLHHIVALRVDTILPWLEDYAAVADPAPRNAVLITGASGTTDIEGSYVRGAHGPGYLHVVLLEAG